MTRSVFQIQPVSRNFDEALDKWLLNQKEYKDQYGFNIPFGKYNPNLQILKDKLFGESYPEHEKFNSP
jgi:hypothetical protein